MSLREGDGFRSHGGFGDKRKGSTGAFLERIVPPSINHVIGYDLPSSAEISIQRRTSQPIVE
ncbi:MAG: hypothetical protein PHQ81_09905 [Methanofollis sp.]|nr:hypothetical protein [Methanofollis sp.]